jgi:hypothetical protein
MTGRWDALLLWSPRVLGILVCLFLGMFALDAFGSGKTFLSSLPDFLVHIMPVAILAGFLALSWRWKWVGGVVFTALAVAYAYFVGMRQGHAEWILPIAGPLLLVGALFLASWLRRGKARPAA